MSALMDGGRYRHVKRGTTYAKVGDAEFQSAIPIEEGVPLTVYRCENGGRLWARPSFEFHDGRFVRISESARKFSLGDRVEKTKGASWRGRVCGVYSTSLTPIGYCVESEREPGSVQIYPEAALALVEDGR